MATKNKAAFRFILLRSRIRIYERCLVVIRDFTPIMYTHLCSSLLENGFLISRVDEYLKTRQKRSKVAIIRHDVDNNPGNALKMAISESKMGINTTYYFRKTKKTFDREIITKIFDLGHEIGYHYETLSKAKGDMKRAINIFERELNEFREIVPISTVCMHGSPLSKWDNLALWHDFSYDDYNIIGEPFLSIDYNTVDYYTDTGRRWDGGDYIIRDKVHSSNDCVGIKNTLDLINVLPSINNDIHLNCHSQRWHENIFSWYTELISQSIKNVIKKYAVKKFYL